MRRALLLAVGCMVAVGSIVGATPAKAAEPVLVKVCVTLNPKQIGISVNGMPLFRDVVVGAPRTCTGI